MVIITFKLRLIRLLSVRYPVTLIDGLYLRIKRRLDGLIRGKLVRITSIELIKLFDIALHHAHAIHPLLAIGN